MATTKYSKPNQCQKTSRHSLSRRFLQACGCLITDWCL